MEKISLNKRVFNKLPKHMSSYLTNSLLGVRNFSRSKLPKTYPHASAITGQISKGSPDIIGAEVATLTAQALLANSTHGLSLLVPSTLGTASYAAITRASPIAKRIKYLKTLPKIEKGWKPKRELHGKYKELAKMSELSIKQKESGNYKKWHVKYDGMDLSIENRAGSTRSGIDGSGNEWSSKMNHHYGYIKETEGKDKDHIDVFVNPGTKDTKYVFVVNQTNDDGEFDEHKCMLGFKNSEEAKNAYLSNYEKDWDNFSSIATMDIDDFKKWVYSGKKTTEATDSDIIKKASPFIELCINSFKSELEKTSDFIEDSKRIKDSFIAGLSPFKSNTKSIAARSESGKGTMIANVAGGTVGGAILIPSLLSAVAGGVGGFSRRRGIKRKILGAAHGFSRGAMDPFRSIAHGVKASKALNIAKNTGNLSEDSIKNIRVAYGFSKNDSLFPNIKLKSNPSKSEINVLHKNLNNRLANNIFRLGLSSSVTGGLTYSSYDKGREDGRIHRGEI